MSEQLQTIGVADDSLPLGAISDCAMVPIDDIKLHVVTMRLIWIGMSDRLLDTFFLSYL